MTVDFFDVHVVITVVATLVVAVGAVLKTGRAQYEFLRAYRQEANPYYPVSPEEEQAKGHEEQVGGALAMLRLAVGTPERLKLYWTKYPEYPQVGKLARPIQTGVVEGLLVLLVGTIAAGAVVLTLADERPVNSGPLVALLAGVALLLARNSYPRAIIRSQNKTWGFNFGEKDIRVTKIMVVGMGLYLLCSSLLWLFGLDWPR